MIEKLIWAVRRDCKVREIRKVRERGEGDVPPPHPPYHRNTSPFLLCEKRWFKAWTSHSSFGWNIGLSDSCHPSFKMDWSALSVHSHSEGFKGGVGQSLLSHSHCPKATLLSLRIWLHVREVREPFEREGQKGKEESSNPDPDTGCATSLSTSHSSQSFFLNRVRVYRNVALPSVRSL